MFGCIPHGARAYARAPVRCAEEALLRRVASPKASLKGPQGAARNRIGKSTRAYRHIHFAVMAIENAAKRMKIPAREMYRRLKAQNLVHNRLLSHYDALHTQGIDWVAEDTVETLLNWEAAK